MKKLLLTIGALALVVPASAADSSSPRVLPWWTQRTCQVEDAVNCYWDAGDGTAPATRSSSAASPTAAPSASCTSSAPTPATTTAASP